MEYIDLTKVDFADIPNMNEAIADLYLDKLSEDEYTKLRDARGYATLTVETNTTFFICSFKEGFSIPLLYEVLCENFPCTVFMAYLYANAIRDLVHRLVNQIAKHQFKTESPSDVQQYGILCDLLLIRDQLKERQECDLQCMKKFYQ